MISCRNNKESPPSLEALGASIHFEGSLKEAVSAESEVVSSCNGLLFEGNPAAECVMEEWLSDNLLQKIALENNLSESAFAIKEGDSNRLRWFTPGGEIDLAAMLLWQQII